MTFPLFPQDAGGQQIGFLLGSCGIALALTTEVCLKGLPKTQNGEIVQFKGELVTDWLLIVLQLQLSCLKGAVRTLKALEGQRSNSWSHHQNAVGFVLVLRSTHVPDTAALVFWGSQGTTSQARVILRSLQWHLAGSKAVLFTSFI